MIPTKIVAFGSSSIQGRGDPEGGGFVGRLENWHRANNPENSVQNLGVVGDSTEKMIDRFSREVPALEPDFIILYPGLNDTRRTGSPGSPTATDALMFAANIDQLVGLAQAQAPTVFISSFPIDESRTRPWGKTNLFYLWDDADESTSACRTICARRQLPYLPIFESWQKLPNFKALSLDGLHGTPEAHQRLFDELKAYICGKFGA